MKMEAPPLPEPQWVMPERMAGKWKTPGAWSADQLRERDAYWLAKVEEARRQALELLRDALGVEVEFKSEATAKHYREAGQTLMATEPPSCAYDCAEAVAGGPRCERGICVNPA